ncbi:hypothetical protein BGX28_006627 [Mortierella sp. GBA30]|nr:hypothetical protein BGX28_006627 [Mortierella sp. GBA30]
MLTLSCCSGKLDGTVLGNYAAKIDTLASVVELSAAVSKWQRKNILGQSGEVYKVSSVSSSTLNIDPSLGLRERRTGMPSDRSYNNLQNEKVLMGNNPRITDSRDTPRDQAQIEATLQNDRAQREEMEAGLSILMQQLRHNALAIHQTLVDEQTSGLLDEADQSLDNNISRLGKERTRLELYSKQSRKTKWMIWAIVLIVSLVFVFMFFIIRIF